MGRYHFMIYPDLERHLAASTAPYLQEDTFNWTLFILLNKDPYSSVKKLIMRNATVLKNVLMFSD